MIELYNDNDIVLNIKYYMMNANNKKNKFCNENNNVLYNSGDLLVDYQIIPPKVYFILT